MKVIFQRIAVPICKNCLEKFCLVPHSICHSLVRADVENTRIDNTEMSTKKRLRFQDEKRRKTGYCVNLP